MLYVTTRSESDTFTAYRALSESRGPDGGFYVPFKPPVASPEELDDLLSLPFNQCAAGILNRLFSVNMTGWDLDFCIGRNPVQLKSMGYRIVMAECWHNPGWNYETLVRNLSVHLCKEEMEQPGDWAKVAIGAAVLFGIFAEFRRAGKEQTTDVCLMSGDFSAVMSVWYARQWGLPIGNIIVCCNENSGIWDLLCHGQMRTDSVSISTSLKEADISLPPDLERLIFACGGPQEVDRYLDCCRSGRTYAVSDAMVEKLRKGLYVSVVSTHRILTAAPRICQTYGSVLSPYTAMAYTGFMDYRARTSQTRRGLLIAERSPVSDSELLSEILGMTAEEIRNYI